MLLTLDERRAVESGQPVRCLIPGTNLRCVIMRDDVFAQLQLRVEVAEDDMLNDIYSDLSAGSSEDWKSPAEWAAGEVQPRKSSRAKSSF